MTASEQISLAFNALAELLAKHPAALQEGAQSWSEFAGVDPNSGGDWAPIWEATQLDPARLSARRRHFEWFCIERPSVALEEAPVAALREALLELLGERGEVTGEALEFLVSSLRDSRLGVYEVGDVDPGVGLWVRDLLAMGEYPVAEAAASASLESGDVLAGRLFPVGDGQFCLSPAMGVFRDPTMLEALKRDVESARAARRGSLRVSQMELERAFFAGASTDPAEAQAALAFLDTSGLEVAVIESWKRQLEGLARAGERAPAMELIGEILDALAFETELDLEQARTQLHVAWDVWVAAGGASDSGAGAEVSAGGQGMPPGEVPQGLGGAEGAGSPTAREVSPDEDSSEAAPSLGQALGSWRRNSASAARPDRAAAPAPADDAAGASREEIAAALEAFDKARSEGGDLEQLFGKLERDLDCSEDVESDSGPAPDFPGVLSALVEEFLWESASQSGDEGANGETDAAEQEQRAEVLRKLAAYGADLGLAEDLNAELLTQFAGRRCLLNGAVPNSTAAYALLGHLEDFARWLSREHRLEVWADFEAILEQLAEALPRLGVLAARRGLMYDTGSPSLQPLGLLRQDPDGRWRTDSEPQALFVDWPDEWLQSLRDGDLAERGADGVVHVLPGANERIR